MQLAAAFLIKLASCSNSHIEREMKVFAIVVPLVFAHYVLVTSSQGEENIDDGSVPRYIQELYNNFTRENSSAGIEVSEATNTIRSLPNQAAVQCGVFNFSLSGIGSHELAKKSELHLYLNRDKPATSSLYVEIGEPGISGDSDNQNFITSRVVPAGDSGWLVFEVHRHVAKLINSGASYAVFETLIYENLPNGDNSGGHLDCGQNPMFIYSSTDNKAPYLAVESFDMRVEQIDYKTILNGIEANDADMSAESNTQSSRRRRRNNPQLQPPVCNVNQLHINTEEIPLAATLGKGTILLPKSYNAGICGGKCGNSLPRDPRKHSQLIHYWVTLRGFESPSRTGFDTTIVQSCAPIQYRRLVVVFKPDVVSEAARMVVLHNMKISQCDCLEVIKFT